MVSPWSVLSSPRWSSLCRAFSNCCHAGVDHLLFDNYNYSCITIIAAALLKIHYKKSFRQRFSFLGNIRTWKKTILRRRIVLKLFDQSGLCLALPCLAMLVPNRSAQLPGWITRNLQCQYIGVHNYLDGLLEPCDASSYRTSLLPGWRYLVLRC